MTTMKINHGILVTNTRTQRVVHFSGYENPPTEADFESLRNELSTDPEFGLVEQADNLFLIEAHETAVDFYRNKVEAQAD